jgi:hypothetical protein
MAEIFVRGCGDAGEEEQLWLIENVSASSLHL